MAACLLAASLALSLAPGTALAQDDPPSVDKVSLIHFSGSDYVLIHFNKEVDIGTHLRHAQGLFSVTVDGKSTSILEMIYFSDDGAIDKRLVGLEVPGHVDENPVVVVTYSKDADVTHDYQLHEVGASGNRVASFAWDVVNNREIPIEQSVYTALGWYFDGQGTLSEAKRFVSSYYEDLKVRLARGLRDLFRIDQPDEPRTAWGTDGTENWGQVGFPWGFPREICTRANDPSSCKDMTEIWGSQYQCGGRNMPGFSGGDHVNFFWACTSQGSQGHWVPVKRHRPGVDYSHDHELKRPGTAEYNNDCLYRDEQGNPAPVFRADFHPQDHPNPQLRGKPIRRPDGSIQGTTIHGGNWDPLAKQCTTRGNR